MKYVLPLGVFLAALSVQAQSVAYNNLNQMIEAKDQMIANIPGSEEISRTTLFQKSASDEYLRIENGEDGGRECVPGDVELLYMYHQLEVRDFGYKLKITNPNADWIDYRQTAWDTPGTHIGTGESLSTPERPYGVRAMTKGKVVGTGRNPVVLEPGSVSEHYRGRAVRAPYQRYYSRYENGTVMRYTAERDENGELVLDGEGNPVMIALEADLSFYQLQCFHNMFTMDFTYHSLGDYVRETHIVSAIPSMGIPAIVLPSALTLEYSDFEFDAILKRIFVAVPR